MKKKINKPMRAAGALLVATMLTTCMTAGTFAKYTTTDSATDSARVAKFGVTIVANGSLFADAYKATTNTPEYTNDAAATVRSITKVDMWAGTPSDDSDDIKQVVAPGTKNDAGLGFAINGTPEVDVQFTGEIKTENVFLKKNETYGVMVKKPSNAVTADNFNTLTANENLYYVSNESPLTYTQATTFAQGNTASSSANKGFYVLQNVVNPTDDYYPVVFNLGSTTGATQTGDTTADSLKAVAQKIADQIGTSVTPTAVSGNNAAWTFTIDSTKGKTIKNNIDLSHDTNGINLENQKITWEWAYEKTSGTTAENAEVDLKDTILGNLMAAKAADTTFTSYGHVVKLSGTTYVDLVEGTDYNLTTSFDITLKATQVD